MLSADYGQFIGRLAAICPSEALASRLEKVLLPILEPARIYLSPKVYSRFTVSLIIYPLAGQLLALFLPMPQDLLIIASLALLQGVPLLFPLTLSAARRRSVDAELPFFLIFLSILARESTPTLDDGLRRVSALGDAVFPAFRIETSVMERDLAFVPGAPAQVIERTFSSHPSWKIREFIHGLMMTLTTGKSVVDYLDEEAARQVQLMEARWKDFSESVGSLAEVSLMVLALFPVGLDMVAAAIPGVGAAQLLLVSLGVLGLFFAILLLLMDAAQPVLYNSRAPAAPLGLALVVWAVSTLLYYRGVISMDASLLVSLAASVLAVLKTHGLSIRIRSGEEEVSILLHGLAEEAKAGVSLPEALSKIADSRFKSIGDPLASFRHSIMLGLSPEDAQKRLKHPSWLVRVSFGMLSAAFVTDAGYEKLERLSSFFRRLSDARRHASRSLLPFFLVGAIVPAISIAAMSFLSTFNQAGVPFIPAFGAVSKTYILVSISAVSVMTGLLLSKLYTQTTRIAIAVPILLSSMLISLSVMRLL